MDTKRRWKADSTASTRGLPRDMHPTSVPVARECLANEGLIVRKPNSGSARHRWAREYSKHRRTATCQRGFCRSFLEQGPLDSIKPGMPPEYRPFKIIGKRSEEHTSELQSRVDLVCRL